MQLRNELKNDSGKLSKKIKKLDFGKYLFLYFVARNTPWRVSNDIMQALKRNDRKEAKTPKTEKTLLDARKEDEETYSQTSGGLPPYTPKAPYPPTFNKNKEERIDMPDSGQRNEYPFHEDSRDKESSEQSIKNRKIKSQSSSPTLVE